jgi:uncharacterized protein (TIGR02231 family)
MMANKRMHGADEMRGDDGSESAMDALVEDGAPEDGMPGLAAMVDPMMAEESSTASSSSSASTEPTPFRATTLSITSVSSGTTSTLFSVMRPANIPSDGQPHKLVIGAVAVTPTFAYKTAPRAAAAAFLIATATNGSPYPLLPGPVRVFLDGAFTTTSKLPLVTPGDTLRLGLGIDPGIQVTSDPVRTTDENRGSSLLGTEARRRAVTHRAVVKNGKKVAVDVEVSDVFPRSEHKELRVILVEKTTTAAAAAAWAAAGAEGAGPSGVGGGEGCESAMVSVRDDAADGRVTWRVHLPPGCEQALTSTHRIEWPKGQEYIQKQSM